MMTLQLGILRAAAAVIVLSMPQAGWTLARWPDANTALPGNLANNVVKVQNGLGGGTGTVICKKDDTTGNGAWLGVLTADHVLRGDINVSIAFNNGQSYSYFSPQWTVSYWTFLGPTVGGGLVDLGFVSMYVTDRTLLPTLENMVTVGGAAVNDDLVLAGYGSTNITGAGAPGPARSYEVDPDYGTYRSGTDKAGNVNNPYTRGIYSFNALQGFLNFTPGAPTWPPTTGDAYVLSGDSGGPTFKGNMLVGVHSGSQSRMVSGTEYIDEGFRWSDVDLGVAAHAAYVTTLCQAVPEPGTIVSLLVGLAGMVGLVSRKKSV